MDSLTETQGIDLLFKKLGHDLSEIRVRALENILSKLKHGLIHDADIVQERQLMVRLLQWFNFQSAPKQDLVLQLLGRLTKFSAACDLLVSLGAITFLSKLRSDLNNNLRPLADTVIDRLLHVTEKDFQQAVAEPRRCIYGKSEPLEEESADSSSSNQPQCGYFMPSDIQPQEDTSSTATPPIARLPGAQAIPQKLSGSQCLRFGGFPWHSLTGTDQHVLTSTGASLCSPSGHLVGNACAFLLDVIFRDFPPEIFLQRPSIVQTLLTLISSRPGGQLMTGALRCVQALGEGLLSRLHFFQDPAFYCPRQGLPFHYNSRVSSHLSGADSFSDSDLVSRSDAEGAIRLERSGGDGRDVSSLSSTSNSARSTPMSRTRSSFPHGFSPLAWDASQINDETENDISSLERSSMTSPQFCVASLIATVPSLKTDNCRLALNLLQTIFPLARLLDRSVRSEQLWSDNSSTALSLQSQVRQLLEIVGDVLLHHYHLDSEATVGVGGQPACGGWVSKHWSKEDGKMHRLIYQTMVEFLLNLIQAVLPINQASREVKSSLCRALFVIASDEALRTSTYGEYEVAYSYLEQCSSEKVEVINRGRKLANSFTHTYSFVKEYKALEEVDECMVTSDLMELVESSIDGLPYHADFNHLRLIVRAISKVFFTSRGQVEDTNELHAASRRVLLRLLAHPLPSIRRTVYEECLRIARAAINVNAAADHVGHSASNIVRFLLDTEVLYEMCCHGLADSSRLVSHPASELIALLIQGRILVAADVWEDFCLAFKPVLPVLQAYTGETEVLRSAITLFISLDEHPLEEWDIHFTRANLRALMLKHRSSRSSAVSQLVTLLYKDDTFPHITGLTDLLMVDTPLSLVPRDETDCFRIRRCVFQEEAIVRMLSVFRSTSTESSVRIGALRQLATMLDDPGLHSAFLGHGGLESVIIKLKALVENDVTVLTDDVKPALAACVVILKLLLRRDALSRERWSHDHALLVSLLRAADLCRLSVASLSEVSVVIALLVFHDVLREYKRAEVKKPPDGHRSDVLELSLPASIATRFQIPFLCPTHHTVSIYRTLVCPPSPACDPLLCGPSAVALRTAWTLAQFDGDTVALCAAMKEKTEHEGPAQGSPDDLIDLRLKEEDLLALTLSHPTTLSSFLSGAIASSQSHSSAGSAFTLMRIAVMSTVNHRSLEHIIFHPSNQLWKDAVAKFLQVAPSCIEDELLLSNLISLLDGIFKIIENQNVDSWNDSSHGFVSWLLMNCVLSSQSQEILGHNESPLLNILESSEPQLEPGSSSDSQVASVAARRELCKGILSLFSRIARILCRHGDLEICSKFHRELRAVILMRLRLADAPQFYDLPSMEVTLECLVHVSATRTERGGRNDDLSTDFTDKALSQQLLGTLLEIVSAFHIGSGASSLSYMGKGVSRCATQCILHLAREMAGFGMLDWPNLLEYTVPSQRPGQSQSVEKVGLEWLVPLWSARDPRTRFAGLAIATMTSRTRQGSTTLANGFQKCPGGLWSTTLCVALDHSECSSVRSQAFNLLSNLASHGFDNRLEWQGPVVEEEGTGATITGVPALQALFHHSHLYDHISLIFSRYCPATSVRSPASHLSHPHGGPSTSEASVASIAGSTSCTDHTGVTPATQPSLSNPFPSLTSSNKVTVSSDHAASGPSVQLQGGEATVRPHPAPTVATPPEEWRSLSTPCLLSSVCRFLCNMMTLAPLDTAQSIVHNGTLYLLNSVLDVDKIQILFDKLSSAPYRQGGMKSTSSAIKRRSILAEELLEQHELITRLHRLVASTDAGIASKLCSGSDAIVRNTMLGLTLHPIDDTWTSQVTRVHQSILDLICILLHQTLKIPLSPAFVRDWHIMFAFSTSILSDDNQTALHCSCCRMLALLFRAETNMSQKLSLTSVLEQPRATSCDSEVMAMTLINKLETLVSSPSAGIHGDVNDRLMATAHALQNLFACSAMAQKAALKAGFVDRLLEELKNQQLKMTLMLTTKQANIPSVNMGGLSKSLSSMSDDTDPHTGLALLLTSLLNNMVHGFVDAKVAAAKSDLGQIVARLWSWTATRPSLLTPLLKLATTFSANCEQASVSLATSHGGGHPCVMTSLVRLCRDVHGAVLSRTKLPPQLQQLTFYAITNCAQVQECRALMWKNNLLELFPSAADRGQHPKRSKHQSTLLDQWLRVLLALSFHTDGQLNVLKIRDLFEILIELHGVKDRSNQVMLIIRNLCFHSPSKHRLSSNGYLVRLLMREINSKCEKSKMAASTALLSLLCNSQKAKVHLKGSGLTSNLQNALAHLTLSGGVNNTDESPHKRALTTMLGIMQS